MLAWEFGHRNQKIRWKISMNKMHLFPTPCGYKTWQDKKGSAFEPTGKHSRKALGRNRRKEEKEQLEL